MLVLRAPYVIKLWKTEDTDDESAGLDGLPKGILLSSLSWITVNRACF